MATTQVLLKVGGMDKVATQPPMRSFSEFTSWRQNWGSDSTRNMSHLPLTQQMIHQEEFIHHDNYSFPWSATITPSSTSSSTSTIPHLFQSAWTQGETTTNQNSSIEMNAKIPSTYQTSSNTTSTNPTGASKLMRALANVGIFPLTMMEMSSLPTLMIYDDPMPNLILPPPSIPPPHILRPPCLNRD